MKKLISLVLALAMVLMVGSALAGKLTINRDDEFFFFVHNICF